jgi:hypothetical protein
LQLPGKVAGRALNQEEIACVCIFLSTTLCNVPPIDVTPFSQNDQLAPIPHYPSSYYVLSFILLPPNSILLPNQINPFLLYSQYIITREREEMNNDEGSNADEDHVCVKLQE